MLTSFKLLSFWVLCTLHWNPLDHSNNYTSFYLGNVCTITVWGFKWNSVRALPDITLALEVRKFFKIRTVWKPDVFPPGHRTFNTVKKRRKMKFFFSFFHFFSIFFCLFGYLVCKMFKNISLDLVQSGRTCSTNLGVRSCLVRKLICPVQSSPTWYHNCRQFGM